MTPSWCQHCSADLDDRERHAVFNATPSDGVQTTLCSRCYDAVLLTIDPKA